MRARASSFLPTTFQEKSLNPAHGSWNRIRAKELKGEREREEEGQRRLQQKLQMEEGRSLTRLSGPFRIAFGRDTRDESEKDAPREKELRTGDETLKSLWDYGRNEISYKSVFPACFSGRCCGLNFV